jgi:hypothetical protein
VVPNGIGIVPPGVRKAIGGLELSANVTTYPAIVVASAPYWPVLALGLLLIAVALVLSARTRAIAT